jgi:ABC-type nitrate/sulfonate/bicarbonate transport system substrate-binding protein
MSSLKFILFLLALLASFYLESSLHAQEKFKKIRVTYPTESIAVLPLFAAYRWKTFEDNDLQAEIIQARSQVANAALASGEIGYFAGVGPASISATLRGLQSRAVWFASDEIIYLLLVRPEIPAFESFETKRLLLPDWAARRMSLFRSRSRRSVKIRRPFFTSRSPRRRP